MAQMPYYDSMPRDKYLGIYTSMILYSPRSLDSAVLVFYIACGTVVMCSGVLFFGLEAKSCARKFSDWKNSFTRDVMSIQLSEVIDMTESL